MRASTTAPGYLRAWLDRAIERVHRASLRLIAACSHRRATPGSSIISSPRSPSSAARHADRPGQVRLLVAEWQAGDERHAERREHLHHHLLRAGRASRASGRRSPRARRPPMPAARASLPAATQLLEHAVDRVRLLADLLEQRGSRRACRSPTACRGSRRPASASRRPVGPRRAAAAALRPRATAARPPVPARARIASSRRRRAGAVLEHRAVEAGEPRLAELPQVERGHVAVADERLPGAAHARRIELGRPCAARRSRRARTRSAATAGSSIHCISSAARRSSLPAR